MNITMQEIRQSLPLKVATRAPWASLAVANLDHFLIDHASCERKAHAAAMMLVNRFPDHHDLQDQMIELAKEELEHFRQVLKILHDRNLSIGTDEVDPYVKALLANVRHPREQHLLDRLIVAALIEARSCERFCLFAEALPNGDLKNFYEKFSREESRHFPLFIRTAKIYYHDTLVNDTLAQMLDVEASILPTLPLKPTVH